MLFTSLIILNQKVTIYWTDNRPAMFSDPLICFSSDQIPPLQLRFLFISHPCYVGMKPKTNKKFFVMVAWQVWWNLPRKQQRVQKNHFPCFLHLSDLNSTENSRKCMIKLPCGTCSRGVVTVQRGEEVRPWKMLKSILIFCVINLTANSAADGIWCRREEDAPLDGTDHLEQMLLI